MADKRNEVLATFTFLATIVVVMCHTDDVLTLHTLPVAIMGRTFSDAHVYNFFALSGYFLGRHLEERGWWRSALTKRISTLIVPYVLWNVIYFIIHILCGHPHAIGVRGLNRLFGIMIGTAPECFPMWYIKTLYMYVFVAPLFAWWLMKFRSFTARIILLATVVGAYCCAKSMGLPATRYHIWGQGGFVPLGFVFFCAGMWLSQIKPKQNWIDCISRRPLRTIMIVAGGWIASAVWTHFNYGPGWYEMNILISSACLFAIACAIAKTPAIFARNTFFLYGAHMVMLEFFGRHLLKGGGNPTVLYAVLLIIVIGLSIMGSEILRRNLPILYAPLVGGRK